MQSPLFPATRHPAPYLNFHDYDPAHAPARSASSEWRTARFSEHLGEGIYGGLWIKGEKGNWQYNERALEALREINLPNLRWPGGCFADYYHWRDGIGPRDERPSIVNTIWRYDSV